MVSVPRFCLHPWPSPALTPMPQAAALHHCLGGGGTAPPPLPAARAACRPRDTPPPQTPEDTCSQISFGVYKSRLFPHGGIGLLSLCSPGRGQAREPPGAPQLSADTCTLGCLGPGASSSSSPLRLDHVFPYLPRPTQPIDLRPSLPVPSDPAARWQAREHREHPLHLPGRRGEWAEHRVPSHQQSHPGREGDFGHHRHPA